MLPTTQYEDGLFTVLQTTIPKTKEQEDRKNACILEFTWILVDNRVSTRRYPERNQTLLRCLCHAINAILEGERRQRTEEAGKAIKKLLVADYPLHKEAWHCMDGWCKDAVECNPPPARVTLKRIIAERVDLYHQVQPPGENIPTSVEPFQVEDLVPNEDGIEWVVRRLWNNLSRGTLGMRAEHLKGWLEEARKAEAAAEKAAKEAVEATVGPGEEDTESERDTKTKKELKNWGKVVDLARADF